MEHLKQSSQKWDKLYFCMLISRFGDCNSHLGSSKMNISFSTAGVELFLNGFILRNICADSWVLSWAVGDVLNSVAREAQSSYHIRTALPVIFASLTPLPCLPALCSFPPLVSLFPRTASPSRSSFRVGPSLFIVPRVCGRSIDPGWDCGKCFTWLLVTHALTACVRRDNGAVTLSRTEDKQLWIGPATRWGC